MYQNIDDIEAIHSPEETQLPYNDARFWLICLVVFGFSVMLAAAIWKYTQKPAIYIHPSDQPEAAQAFQKIQSETRASLRRARLIDFTQNHPDSPVINGARQQLRVRNGAKVLWVHAMLTWRLSNPFSMTIVWAQILTAAISQIQVLYQKQLMAPEWQADRFFVLLSRAILFLR